MSSISSGEIISILKSEIENYDFDARDKEVGTVIWVGDGIVTIYGIDNAMYGEIVVFENGVKGMVQDIRKTEIGCILFGRETGIKEGTKVTRTGKRAGIPVSDKYLGRIVDALGAPIDGKGKIETTDYRPIEQEAPGIIDRKSVSEPMETGILSIDSMFPIGRGQRELIIGDRQTGKTSIATDTIINQKGKDVICVYVAIGQKASTVAKIVSILEKNDAMDYTIIVASTASDPAPLQYIAPYSGTSIAEHFMHSGKDVLIVYDDLSKHAVAYRTLITNAMYMISSTKLRKAKKNLEETEPYFYTLQTMVSRIVRHLPEIDNKYFDERKDKPAGEKTTGLIVVTADKGLAGAYNHNVLKMAEEQMQKAGQTGSYKLFVVGELGRQYFGHRGIKVAEQFHYTAQNPTLHRARIITETILEQFEEEQLDEVYIIYTNMVNSVTTEPQMLRLLPIIKERFITKDGQDLSMYQEPLVMTPSPKAVLDNIVPDFVMGYVYGALVESFCSEQNARMMAMEAANKNASAMIHDLSIQYNRVRQAMITQEITEVIAGAKAQKKKKKARKEVLSN